MKHILAALVFMFSIGTAYAGHLKVTLDDLLLLTESRVSDKTILAFIGPREITFTLGTEEIEKLRKAGLSEEVIKYLLAKSRQADLTYNQYINPPVPYPYPYPGYYYGPSLYLGFGGGHHALFDHHFVSLHHAAPHHTGLHRGTPFHVAHSRSTGGHHIGHTSQFAVGSGSTHSTSINSSHNTGRGHSILGRKSHHTSGSSAQSTRSTRHDSNRSHGTLGRSSHNTSGIGALISSHHSNRSHNIQGHSSHHTSSSRAHSTNRRSSHSSSHSGGHGGRGHSGSHGGRGHGGGH